MKSYFSEMDGDIFEFYFGGLYAIYSFANIFLPLISGSKINILLKFRTQGSRWRSDRFSTLRNFNYLRSDYICLWALLKKLLGDVLWPNNTRMGY